MGRERGNDRTLLIFLDPMCPLTTQNPSGGHLGQNKLRRDFVHIAMEVIEESKQK